MDAIDGDWVTRPCPGSSAPRGGGQRAHHHGQGGRAGLLRSVPGEGDGGDRGADRGAGPAGPGLGGAAERSLLLSVVLRPPLPRGLVWLTVAAARSLPWRPRRSTRSSATPAGLKWPNDTGSGRAQGGRPARRRPTWRTGWPRCCSAWASTSTRGRPTSPEVADRATSVNLAAGAPVDQADLAAWAGHFLEGYASLRDGRPGPVLAAYRERLVTVGRRVRADRVGAPPRWWAPPST